eukprot:GHUV01052256.1.p1 GENE.GHUV01052256.1~~GHUV01052256.1.p1  ORF type:complete len:100 (+),score=21.01 GHUV01052256.1:196-495(+)
MMLPAAPRDTRTIINTSGTIVSSYPCTSSRQARTPSSTAWLGYLPSGTAHLRISRAALMAAVHCFVLSLRTQVDGCCRTAGLLLCQLLLVCHSSDAAVH